jgi:hypothetical protein
VDPLGDPESNGGTRGGRGDLERAFADLLVRGQDAGAIHFIALEEHIDPRESRCTCPKRPCSDTVPNTRAMPVAESRTRCVMKSVVAYEKPSMLSMETWRGRFPELVDWPEGPIERLPMVFSLPVEYGMSLRTTISLARYHQEVRRCSRVADTFPNLACYMRISSALAMEQPEGLINDHHYLEMGPLEEFKPRPAELAVQAPKETTL